MKNTKLFVVSEMFCDTGFGVVATEVLRRLAARDGVKISAMAINAWTHKDLVGAEEAGVSVLPACGPSEDDPYGEHTLPQLLKIAQPDAVWFNNDIGPVWKWWQLTKKALPDARPAAVAGYIAVDGPVLMPWLFADILEDGVQIVTYTQYGVDEVEAGLRRCGRWQERFRSLLSFIPLAVDTAVFRPPESRVEVRRRLNVMMKVDAFRDDDFVINITNRNAARKMIGMSIVAASTLARETSNVKVLVRSGLKDLGGDFQAYLSYVGAPKEQVILAWPGLAGGRGVPKEVLAALYQASDVFVSASISEGHGLCEHEAAACGCALVLPNNTVRPELWGAVATLVDCPGEFCVPANCQTLGRTTTSALLAAGLRAYRDNPELLVDRRVKCAERAASLSSWDKITSHMEALLWPTTTTTLP